MHISDLENLKAEMEKNHKASIDAIERVLEKMRDAARGSAAVVQVPRLEERMSVIIERIITKHVGNFAICDVARKYQELTGKRASVNVRKEISNCINKLKHRNPPEIDEVQAGRGSRSGIYKLRKN